MRIKRRYSDSELADMKNCWPISRVKRHFLIPRKVKFTTPLLFQKIRKKMDGLFPPKEELENKSLQELRQNYDIPVAAGMSKQKAIKGILEGEIKNKTKL